MSAPVVADLCTAQTGPIWKNDGEPCGCTVEVGPDGTHDGDHMCSCGAWWVDRARRFPA